LHSGQWRTKFCESARFWGFHPRFFCINQSHFICGWFSSDCRCACQKLFALILSRFFQCHSKGNRDVKEMVQSCGRTRSSRTTLTHTSRTNASIPKVSANHRCWSK
jgi:hypothetical protein